MLMTPTLVMTQEWASCSCSQPRHDPARLPPRRGVRTAATHVTLDPHPRPAAPTTAPTPAPTSPPSSQLPPAGPGVMRRAGERGGARQAARRPRPGVPHPPSSHQAHSALPIPHSRPHTTTSLPTPPHTSPLIPSKQNTSAWTVCRSVCSHSRLSSPHTRTSR